MFANTQMGGLSFAFPDVCLTPSGPAVVPVPYPNLAMGSMATPTVTKVLFGGAPVQNMRSRIPLTQGDAAGSSGGVMSGGTMGKAQYVEGASSVLVGGAPVTRLTSSTLQNSGNASGSTVAPSQTKVLVTGS